MNLQIQDLRFNNLSGAAKTVDIYLVPQGQDASGGGAQKFVAAHSIAANDQWIFVGGTAGGPFYLPAGYDLYAVASAATSVSSYASYSRAE